MAVFTPTKTIQVQLISLQNLATVAASAGTGRLASSVLDVSTKIAAQIMAKIGRTVVTAFTASQGCDIYIQGSAKAADDDEWYDLVTFGTGALAACSTNLVTAGGGAAGTGHSATAITLSANAAISYSIAKQWLYFRNGTVANGEFHRARWAGTASTALWIDDDLTRAQNSDNIYNGNLVSRALIDLSGVTRLRALAINNAGVSVDVEVSIITFDNMTG